jgi:valyl-tRNA synthetase
MKILVPMAGLIDVAAERDRLQKRRDKTVADEQKITAKLANEKFVTRAPEDVVAKERGRQEALLRDISQLDVQLAKLAELD